MTQNELTLVIAAAFLFAVVLGWMLRWGFARLNRTNTSTSIGSNELAARLHTAEEARDAAYRERDEAVRDLRKRLDQSEAELAAMMDGLRTARQETEQLRDALSQQQSG